MTAQTAVTNHVLEHVIDMAEPWPVEGPWRRLRLDANCLRWPADGLNRLRALCEDRQLRASGLLDESGRPGRKLPEPGAPLLSVRAERDGPATDVITTSGPLGHEGPALRAILEDWHVKEMLPKTAGRLFLVTELEDLFVLRGLSIPAAPAIGLTGLHRRELDALRSIFSWDSWGRLAPAGPSGVATQAQATPPGAGAGTRPTHLTIVGFSVSRLDGSPPDGLDQLLTRFTRLLETTDLDLSRVSVWQPDPAALARVRHRIRAQGLRAGREGLLNLLTSSTRSLAGYRRLHRSALSEAGDYEQARAELRRVVRRGPLGGASAERLESIEQRLADAVDADLIAPMQQAARETSDLVDRTRWLAAAELARLVFLTAPAVESGCGLIFGRNGAKATESEPSRRVAQFAKLTGQLCHVLKEISDT